MHVRSRDNGRQGLGAPPLPAAACALCPPPSRVLVPAAAAARLFSPLRASRCRRRRSGGGGGPAGGGLRRARAGCGAGARRGRPEAPGEGLAARGPRTWADAAGAHERGACRRWGQRGRGPEPGVPAPEPDGRPGGMRRWRGGRPAEPPRLPWAARR